MIDNKGVIEMKVGYARVSTKEQNLDRQLETLKNLGAEKIFCDKLSGKDMHRPQLRAMLDFVREGDTVIVSEYSRLARSTTDLFKIVDELKAKNVKIKSDKENFDTSTPQGEFMLTVFAGISQFERAVLLQRQREGIAIAKAQGKYKGRQPIAFDEVAFKRDLKKWEKGEVRAVDLQKIYKMKPARFYRLAKKYGATAPHKEEFLQKLKDK